MGNLRFRRVRIMAGNIGGKPIELHQPRKGGISRRRKVSLVAKASEELST